MLIKYFGGTFNIRMSTFLGLIDEIPGISVDRFDGENRNSSAYFLSHCHTDHMEGLSYTFFMYLIQYNKYLYCSPISKILLESKFGGKDKGSLLNFPCIKAIEVDEKFLVEHKSEGNVEITDLFVTCISAGHCPGSVMFLFERLDKFILYTGDFRINTRDYRKLKSLHYHVDSNRFPKKLAKMYLDTTFLDSDFRSFPTRKETINVMGREVRDWLKKSSRNVVVLDCSATYGSEYLYKELSTFLKDHIKDSRVHVKHYVHESYCRISNLESYITNDPLSARIHACMKKGESLKCRTDVLEENILTIVPSAMKWRGEDSSKIGEWDKQKARMYNVCYSVHASYSELEEFILYFKPEEIYPCVCPSHESGRIFYLLNKIKSKIRR
ncbi:PREDICTED: protein artemis [Vollenhovia emeryi]|uniref:protein artemis n=1 Tax=Vollenhovia emeryi TaxID=411798 RepID=UPI0005F4002A|nr:PREDICTED: protein artemis [Vollenhovia emeryi]